MFDSLRKLLSPEETEEVEVGFGRFEDWFKEETEGMRRSLKADIEEGLGDVDGLMEGLEESLESLEGREITGDIAPRLEKMGKTNKEVLVNRLKGFVKAFGLKTKEPEELLEEVRDASREFQELSEDIQKNLLIVQKAYENVDVLGYLKKLEGKLEELEKSLQKGGFLEKSNDIKRVFSEISEARERKGEIVDSIEEKEREIEGKEERKNELEEELEGLEDSEDVEEIESIQGEIEGLEREVERIENRVRKSISPLKRAMKKVQYLGSSSDGGFLERYIDSPLEAVKDDEELSSLKNIKEEVEGLLDEKGLDFEGKERDRLKEHLKGLDVPKIAEEREKISKLEGDIEEKVKERDGLDMSSRKEDIRGKIKDLGEEIRELTEEIDELEGEKKRIQQKIKEERRNIEDKVKELLNVRLELN